MRMAGSGAEQQKHHPSGAGHRQAGLLNQNLTDRNSLRQALAGGMRGRIAKLHFTAAGKAKERTNFQVLSLRAVLLNSLIQVDWKRWARCAQGAPALIETEYSKR